MTDILSKEKFEISKPELIAMLLYVQGPEGKIGEEIVGKTRLMKLVFLLLKEMNLENNLSGEASFEPYKYGPFDVEIYDAIDALMELGVIEKIAPREQVMEEDEENLLEPYDANTKFKLTEFGIERSKELAKSIPKDVLDKFVKVKTIYAKIPLIQLLHYVYGKYPEYATLSEANI